MALKKWLSRVSGMSEDTLERAWHRDRGRDELLETGLAGTATVVEARGVPKSDDGSSDILKRDERLMFLLEIQVADGRAPYQLQGTWKVPRFYQEWGWVVDVEAGMQLPVKVKADDPERVAIDWRGFEAAGGKQLVEEAQRKFVEERRDEAVAFGTELSVNKLDQQVAKGKLTQEQAGQQKRAIDMANSGQLDDMPPADASPRQMLEWQVKKGLMDQATFDQIVAANPNLK